MSSSGYFSEEVAGAAVDKFKDRPIGTKAAKEENKKRKVEEAGLLGQDEKELMREGLELKKRHVEGNRLRNKISNVKMLVELFGREARVVRNAMVKLEKEVEQELELDSSELL